MSGQIPRKAVRGIAAAAGLGAAAYLGYAGFAFLRYGKTGRAIGPGADPLLDRFMPHYEVADRHSVRVDAPAEVTLAAAGEMELDRSPLVRAIFKAREVIVGAERVKRNLPRGLLEQTRALGWGVLAEVPGRQVIMGAVTQPWKADVVFRAVPPEEFAAFDEPDHVKIVWTLRADPLGARKSIFSMETRAIATDRCARAKFRPYWAFFSPGIILLRLLWKRPLKAEAEGRARAARLQGKPA